jgi:hypothetical protein
MALFKVNMGCREEEVCRREWDYEVKVPESDTSVFIIPGYKARNSRDRLVVLNRAATSVEFESQAGGPEQIQATLVVLDSATLDDSSRIRHQQEPTFVRTATSRCR